MTTTRDRIASALSLVVERRETLSRLDARLLLDEVLSADAEHMQLRIAGLFAALAARGETTQELAGFVDSLQAHAIPVPLADDERERLVDTCGTGGDYSNTFNISTGAALVAAAAGADAGIMVAKHGNRAITSRSGSADVLEALGIPIDHVPEQAAASLRRRGFAFLSAAAFHPAMKAVMPLRKALGVRTAFNILGPMANPARARAQVLGVYAESLVPLVADVLLALEMRHAFVVFGGGMDEFSLSGSTAVAEVRQGAVRFFSTVPGDFGLHQSKIESVAGGDARTNAKILRSVFADQPGPCRDVVVMNASAVLVTAGLASDFVTGAHLAAEAIASGKVAALVAALAEDQST